MKNIFIVLLLVLGVSGGLHAEKKSYSGFGIYVQSSVFQDLNKKDVRVSDYGFYKLKCYMGDMTTLDFSYGLRSVSHENYNEPMSSFVIRTEFTHSFNDDISIYVKSRLPLWSKEFQDFFKNDVGNTFIFESNMPLFTIGINIDLYKSYF